MRPADSPVPEPDNPPVGGAPSAPAEPAPLRAPHGSARPAAEQQPPLPPVRRRRVYAPRHAAEQGEPVQATAGATTPDVAPPDRPRAIAAAESAGEPLATPVPPLQPAARPEAPTAAPEAAAPPPATTAPQAEGETVRSDAGVPRAHTAFPPSEAPAPRAEAVPQGEAAAPQADSGAPSLPPLARPRGPRLGPRPRRERDFRHADQALPPGDAGAVGSRAGEVSPNGVNGAGRSETDEVIATGEPEEGAPLYPRPGRHLPHPMRPPRDREPALVSAPAPPLPPPPEPAFTIRLAPDPRLNLAYNTQYTNQHAIRQEVLEDRVRQTAEGGRAPCWRCEKVHTAYHALNTPLGYFVLAHCEACQTWSLL